MMKKLLVSISAILLIAHCSIQSITPMQAAATAHARTAYERHADIDPAVIQMIHDVIEQIAVPTSIADYAAEQNWNKVMELALKPGVNLNAQDEKGCTALMYAIYRGQDAVARFLIDMKDEPGRRVVDLNGKDSKGCTSLMYTVEFGRLELFKYLVEQKDENNNWVFDLNEQNNDGETIFIMAAGGLGHLEIVRYLAEIKTSSGRSRAIDLNACTKWGHTALMRATLSGQLETVQYIMQIKDSQGKRIIDVYARDYQGHTALDLACKRSYGYDTKIAAIRDYLLSLNLGLESNSSNSCCCSRND